MGAFLTLKDTLPGNSSEDLDRFNTLCTVIPHLFVPYILLCHLFAHFIMLRCISHMLSPHDFTFPADHYYPPLPHLLLVLSPDLNFPCLTMHSTSID